MVSRKIIGPALAGTGAVGVPGALSWTLDLFGGGSLENSSKQPEVKAQNSQKTQTSSGKSSSTESKHRTITKVKDNYFTAAGEASGADKKVIDSKMTLSVEWYLESLWVKAKKEDEADFSWECRLEPISIEEEIDSNHKVEEFKRQKEELKKALEDENNKKQFVANCSYTRLSNEKPGGKESIIELETERISYNRYKFKEKDGYFKRLWTEDFRGVDRIEKDKEWLLENESNFVSKIEGKKESETTGKVEMSLVEGSKKWVCNILGTSTNNLENKTFKKNNLEEILKMKKWSRSGAEKKRYLIRNCAKNNGEIKGLKIKVSRSNWEFEDQELKQITEGMYENPKEAKPQNPLPN